jgi:hypothetical protein
MVNSVDLPTDLAGWIRDAGMELIQGLQTDDGRTVIWNRGGERRYFIGIASDYYLITSSDRMGAEHFHLGAHTIDILEKYLYGHFGNSVRKARGLQRVQKPYLRPELKRGYRLLEVTFAGEKQDALIDSAGSTVAIAAEDRLVELSHYVEASTTTIKNSFLDPDGKPLFSRSIPH